MYLRSRHWLFGKRALFMAVCIFTSYMVVPPIEMQATQVIEIQEETTELHFNKSTMFSMNTADLIKPQVPEIVLEEPIIEVYIPRFSDYEISLLERVTMSESGNQPFDCQVAVAQTIINRLDSGRFGDSIYSIVYEQHQYSTGNNGAPTDSVKSAVYTAVNNPPYPSNMVYFRESYYHTFAVDYQIFGVLYFSLYE